MGERRREQTVSEAAEERARSAKKLSLGWGALTIASLVGVFAGPALSVAGLGTVSIVVLILCVLHAMGLLSR